MGAPGSTRLACGGVFSRAGPSIGGRRNDWKSRSSNCAGSPPSWGNTSFSSSPAVEHQRSADLGAHAHPVDTGGGRRVPLVSTATSKPSSMHASTSAVSSCSSGSPRCTRPYGAPALDSGHARATAAAKSCGVAKMSAARSVGPDEVGVAELADRRAGLLHGRSTGCIRRTGRTQPGARLWSPRPAGCRRFP